MSSTSDQRARLAQFFRDELIPAAERVAASGKTLLELAPDSSVGSYYSERTGEDTYVFRSSECEDLRNLAVLWKLEGHEELIPLAERLPQLAVDLAPDQAQTDEVSPLIYAMF